MKLSGSPRDSSYRVFTRNVLTDIAYRQLSERLSMHFPLSPLLLTQVVI